MPTRLYFDAHATTPCDPQVVDAMLPFFSERFGNAASLQHAYGWDAQQAVESARQHVADLVGARGAHILRLHRRIPGQTMPFDMARDRIADMLEARSWSVEAARYVAGLAARNRIEGVRIEGAVIDCDAGSGLASSIEAVRVPFP